MKKANIVKLACVCAWAVGVVYVYGTWPRVNGQLVSHKTYREVVGYRAKVREVYSNYSATFLYEEAMQNARDTRFGTEPSASKTYQFGPEDHPGFYDAVPGEERGSELEKTLRAMVIVESGGNSNAVGDIHLRHKAYGALQIRQPYLSDVNRIRRDAVVKQWGRLLTIGDMKDREKAWWVAKQYLGYYGAKYQEQTGKAPDIAIYARLHNGGPNGWERASTNAHCRKVIGVAKELE